MLLRFFRINDPYRLIVIFFLLIVLRLPVMIGGGMLTVPELGYMLVGERLNSGAAMYTGIWDSMAPLSAMVYYIIDLLFGRSQLAYQIVALLVVFFQTAIFNMLLLRNKAYNENTYVPGAIYAVLMSIFFDFYTLTPILMGLTFLLLALNSIFSHIEFRAKKDEQILNIGLYLGVATLFYLPFFIYGVAALLIFVFFTGTVSRRYFLMIFGFALPVLLAWGYYFLFDRHHDFISNFFMALFIDKKEWFFSIMDILIIFAVPAGFFLMSVVKMMQRSRLNNYQSRLAQTIFVWLVFTTLFMMLTFKNTPNAHVVFVPVLSYYLSHYFLLIRRRFLAELSFGLFVGLVLFMSYSFYYQSDFSKKLLPLHHYVIDTQAYQEYEGKKILVLDKDIRPYYHATPATPFVNWHLSRQIFIDTDYYDNITVLYDGISTDMPEVILDPENVMPAILNKIPDFHSRYRAREQGVYELNAE